MFKSFVRFLNSKIFKISRLSSVKVFHIFDLKKEKPNQKRSLQRVHFCIVFGLLFLRISSVIVKIGHCIRKRMFLLQNAEF